MLARKSLEQSLDSQKSLCEDTRQKLVVTEQQVADLSGQVGVSQQVKRVLRFSFFSRDIVIVRDVSVNVSCGYI